MSRIFSFFRAFFGIKAAGFPQPMLSKWKLRTRWVPRTPLLILSTVCGYGGGNIQVKLVIVTRCLVGNAFAEANLGRAVGQDFNTTRIGMKAQQAQPV